MHLHARVKPNLMSRRSFVLGAATLATVQMIGCETSQADSNVTSRQNPENNGMPDFNPKELYRSITDMGIDLPAVNYRKLADRLCRKIVACPPGVEAGTLLVRPAEFHLYLCNNDGTAIRYGVGVGAEGHAWSGTGVIGRKEYWPRWTPPAEMLRRNPALSSYAKGMSGGIENPLGARALYIFSDNVDTLYRVHGTPEWWSIGRELSSGCIRLLNQDVIDLHARVTIGAPIVVAT